MDRTDCLENVVGYVRGLNQIADCVKKSIRDADMLATVDCINKFYTAMATVSAAISMYNGVLTQEEILKYNQTLNAITNDLRADSIELARKVKCFSE